MDRFAEAGGLSTSGGPGRGVWANVGSTVPGAPFGFGGTGDGSGCGTAGGERGFSRGRQTMARRKGNWGLGSLGCSGDG